MRMKEGACREAKRRYRVAKGAYNEPKDAHNEPRGAHSETKEGGMPEPKGCLSPRDA